MSSKTKLLNYLDATSTFSGLFPGALPRTLPFISSKAFAASEVLLNLMYTTPTNIILFIWFVMIRHSFADLFYYLYYHQWLDPWSYISLRFYQTSRKLHGIHPPCWSYYKWWTTLSRYKNTSIPLLSKRILMEMTCCYKHIRDIGGSSVFELPLFRVLSSLRLLDISYANI